jgi:hypothetical protein
MPYNPNIMPDYYIPEYNNEPSSYRVVNLLEIILVILVIIGLIISSILGFASKNNDNRDSRRRSEINQIVTALGFYYGNSSGIPNDRRYPVSVCSGQLNEVDYEYTLRKLITGSDPKVSNFAYINNDQFPMDMTGVIADSKSQSRIPKRNCDKGFGGFGAKDSDKIYNNEFQSCNFSRDKVDFEKANFWESKSVFQHCYLYSSDDRGFNYQLGYYSEVAGQFVVVSQDRGSAIKSSLVNN